MLHFNRKYTIPPPLSFSVLETLAFMAPKKLTEYERRRLENIRRNDEMMAALKIQSKATELSSATKRQRAASKEYKRSPAKKSKAETPIVIRRSLRTRGICPEHKNGIIDESINPKINNSKWEESRPSAPINGPLSMEYAYKDGDPNKTLIETIISVSKKSGMGSIDKGSNEAKLGGAVDESEGSCDLVTGVSENETLNCVVGREYDWIMESVDLTSLSLKPHNVARVMQGRILNVKFFPTTDVNMIVAGNKFGDVAFWNVDSGVEEGDGIYLYHAHEGPVSGISIQPSSLSKIFTSCYNGLVRLMDAEKEVFDLLYSSDEAIFSLSQNPNDMKCLFFGEGKGALNNWDERAGKSSSSWILHEDRINSIDFNSENPNIMATSSTDGTACIWDLRSIDADRPNNLKTVKHRRAVHSAYFSPSGRCIATTSIDNTVGILNGVNYEDMSMIYHYNQTGRWISSFRGIWGWDDSHVFIGNMKRGVDVLSRNERKTIMTLQSEHISAIPCRFDAHPNKVGMLAGATSGGQVYIWTI